MPEIFGDKKVFSLLEVAISIQRTISDRYQSSFWVKAEMNKLNHYSHSGHCYPELVEKKDGRVIAQFRCNLWKDDYRRINEKFLSILKEPIRDGINILFAATISFDPSHGLSLRILDIDPAFSLGELEREKQETIDKLQKDGVFDNNRKTVLALLPKRIAVISVETSKGYADYLKIIDQNPWGYHIVNVLFPAVLQGERSVWSIRNQLKNIKILAHHFDAVAIIRGGGGDVGLSSYNNYELAKDIAVFPIPVITGIGHSTNETVAELVSFKNAITPTELADFLIQKFHDFSGPVRRAEEIILERSGRILMDESLRLKNAIKYFQSVTNNQLQKNHHAVDGYSKHLIQQSKFIIRREQYSLDQSKDRIQKNTRIFFKNEENVLLELPRKLRNQTGMIFLNQKQTLHFVEKNVDILNPVNILRRGYSITLNKDGKAIKHATEVHVNDTITTILADGEIVSTIIGLKKPVKNDE
jgi:exodeoxyribonuclease VII large subunit